MTFAPITNQLENDRLNEQPILETAQKQAEAAEKMRQAKMNVFNENQANQTNQWEGSSGYDNISSMKSASEAEAAAASQKTSLREMYNNAKQVPQRLREAKQESNKYGGRLSMANNGLSSDISNPASRNEKWGGNKMGFRDGGMTSTIGSLYKKAKESKKQGALGKIKDEGLAAMKNAISMATSEALKQSWLNIIDSFGLTLIYIYFHVFCRFVFGPEVFCKLGHEWLGGKSGGGASGVASKGASAAKGAGKSSSGLSETASSFFGLPFAAIGIAEAALLALITVLIVVCLFIALTPLMIVAMMFNGELSIWDSFGVLWKAVKALL